MIHAPMSCFRYPQCYCFCDQPTPSAHHVRGWFSRVGPARAKLLAERLGITSVAELARAAQEHRLRGLPGIGPTSEAVIAREAARVAQLTRPTSKAPLRAMVGQISP